MSERETVRGNAGAYRKHLEEAVDVLPLEELARRADEWLNRHGAPQVAGLTELPAGTCHDCEAPRDPDQTPRIHRRLYAYGDRGLELCRHHATVRARCIREAA